MDALDGKCPVEIPGHAREPGVWIADEVRVDAGVAIYPPVFLGPGCRVSSGACLGPYAVLGRSCEVGRGSRVERSILWDGVRIEHQQIVEDRLVSRTFHCPLAPQMRGTE
jgi:NDP-sugar pyrophosphorylase family protein